MLTRRGLMLGLTGLPVAGAAAAAIQDGGLITAGGIRSEQITATEGMPIYDPRKETVQGFEARRDLIELGAVTAVKRPPRYKR